MNLTRRGLIGGAAAGAAIALEGDRGRLLRLRELVRERRIREVRAEQAERGWYDQGMRQGGLIAFVRYFWHILEPETELVEGWALWALVEHLEAVTYGEITKLLINVPPGFMKSLLVDVFWPAWEWGAMAMPHLRYVAFSYASTLTERDNNRFRDLLTSVEYRELYGDIFRVAKTGEVRITNDKTGWKFASSVGGVGTGERGDRVILDDPHNVKEAESDQVRQETVRWFRESMSNRFNDPESGCIIVIMQRVHEDDVSGCILDLELGYVHLMIAMEMEEFRRCETSIGWIDPREKDGELAWPERFSQNSVDNLKITLGPYAYSAQYQQSPSPRAGGIFVRDWWQIWEPGSDEALAIADHAPNQWPVPEYVVGSMDGAYTEEEQEKNDPSAMTVWGLWYTRSGFPRVGLMNAWRKRLRIHGPILTRRDGESELHFRARSQPQWGLAEWTMYTARRFKCDVVLVEAKASGISAAQSMQSLFGEEAYNVILRQVKGDKVARAQVIVPFLAAGMVYAPAAAKADQPADGTVLFRAWAQMVIDEMASFPKHKHDDLTDTASQAFKYLREIGLLRMPDEAERDNARKVAYRPRNAPLYPGARA